MRHKFLGILIKLNDEQVLILFVFIVSEIQRKWFVNELLKLLMNLSNEISYEASFKRRGFLRFKSQKALVLVLHWN
jgi:hypothetical protein